MQARRSLQQSHSVGQQCVNLRDDRCAIAVVSASNAASVVLTNTSMSAASAVRLASGVVMRVWSTNTVELSCWLASLARRTSLARKGRDCVSNARSCAVAGRSRRH